MVPIWLAYGILYGLVFCLGAVIGSFANVCIYRLPQKLSVAQGRSFCPACGHTLGVRDLIPLLSWLGLRGRCRFCHQKISSRYFWVELLTGLLFLLALQLQGWGLKGLVLALFFAVLVVIAYIDGTTGYIYDSTVIALVLLAILSLCLPPRLPIWQHLLGSVIISLPLLLLAALCGGFGGGDVKLMAAAGLFLGAKLVVIAFLLATVAAALYSFVLLVTRRAKLKSAIPFGPFLCGGLVLAATWGEPLCHWYLSLMGL